MNKLTQTRSQEQINKNLTKFRKEYPLIPHTSAGRLFSVVRRMKAEKEFNIPIKFRNDCAISVENRKSANNLTEQEWEGFYKDLSRQLKRDYPSLYDRVFPD